MKLLNLFKISPDLELLPADAWEPDGELNVDVSYLRTVWNCFDESALAISLNLRDEDLENTSLTAFTIGTAASEIYMRTLYALGFETCARLDPGARDLRFDPAWTAQTICAYTKRCGGFDALIFGQQSAEGNNSMTPLICAELLNVPCITQVMDIHRQGESALRVTYAGDQGAVTRTVKTPCVLAVGNSEISCLRVPTLKNKMTLGKKPVSHVTEEELGGPMQTVQGGMRLCALRPVTEHRKAELIAGDTPEEKAQRLYDQYIRDRMGD